MNNEVLPYARGGVYSNADDAAADAIRLAAKILKHSPEHHRSGQLQEWTGSRANAMAYEMNSNGRIRAGYPSELRRRGKF